MDAPGEDRLGRAPFGTRPVALYCLPYAGGNAYAYRALQEVAPPGLRVQGIELPGRGSRAREPLRVSLDDLADDVFAQLQTRLAAGHRYALFGHSMGAALAYLGLLRLRDAALPLPEVLFVSGKAAPCVGESTTRHRLPRQQFIEMLTRLGGFPRELLAHDELIDYFEPILRADFEAVETWSPPACAPLPVRLVALIGSADEVRREQAAAWSTVTSGAFELHEYAGDHFFINAHWRAIAVLIARTLGLAPATAPQDGQQSGQGAAVATESA